jgi:hypothetical protein
MSVSDARRGVRKWRQLFFLSSAGGEGVFAAQAALGCRPETNRIHPNLMAYPQWFKMRNAPAPYTFVAF